MLIKYKLPLVLLIHFIVLLACSGRTQSVKFIDVSKSHLNVEGLDNNTMDASVVDLDGDSDLDIILAVEFRKNIVLFNDGDGKFENESDERLPNSAHDSEDIAAADFDNDGDIDLIFVSEDDQINEYYINDGNGIFQDASYRLNVHGITNAVEAEDFDNDGDIDLILGNAGQNYFLTNDGRGNFRDETSLRLPKDESTTQDIESGDVDGDGDLDLVIANETQNHIWINNGSGEFKLELNLLPPIDDQTREVDLGDIDNDNDLDLVFANVDFGGIGNPQNRLLLNDGTGNFEEITKDALPVSSYRTVDIDLVDINQDGFLDILSGNRFNGNDQLVLINDGKLSFQDSTEEYFSGINMYIFDFQTADFNNDGIMDIYLCGFRGKDKLLFGK